MKKGRKQIYYSYKLTQVLSTQTSYFSLPSALLCISPRATPCHYRSSDPTMYVEISIRKGRCVSVCAFLLVVGTTRTWLQSSRASALHSSSQQNLPAITGTIMPHSAIQCTTSCFGPGSNVFEDQPFPLSNLLMVTMTKVACPCLRHATDHSMVH